jgi:GNAT superfamily N-acetyltransferase
MNLSIHKAEEISLETHAQIFKGINDQAVRLKNQEPMRTFGLSLEGASHSILGGASGVTYYGCLYVDMLWIDDSIRHQGWGSKLMKEAEKIGIERGCTFATVNTMDWEALDFYRALGYAIEFTRTGYKKDSKLFMLRKALSQEIP